MAITDVSSAHCFGGEQKVCEHTSEVLSDELGLDDAQLGELRSRGVIT